MIANDPTSGAGAETEAAARACAIQQSRPLFHCREETHSYQDMLINCYLIRLHFVDDAVMDHLHLHLLLHAFKLHS